MTAALENPRRSSKGHPMWVYDGDEWINEGATVPDAKSDNQNPRREEFYPELQVLEVEIVPPTQTHYIPMLPLH